ncbi:hypothetical protein [Streptomyces sp. NPDC015131]|uniref:DUF6197 family protein n=1 Tax=Streptomyces sp. NPDC015131 TaxID=3364941 RepID=UPI0036F9536B
MTNMTPEEILNTAADIILRDGWHQGDTDDGDTKHGPVCLMGAIDRAVTGNSRGGVAAISRNGPVPEVNEAVQRVINTIARWDIGEWNDHSGRTVEDVLLALKKAATDTET